jgi:hypothetical protein
MGSSTFLPFTSLLMVAVLFARLHTMYEDRESRGSEINHAFLKHEFVKKK